MSEAPACLFPMLNFEDIIKLCLTMSSLNPAFIVYHVKQ